MSLLAWRIVAAVCLFVSIVSFMVLSICKFNVNRLYKNFTRDELVRRTKGVNSTNYLYFTNRETSKYINKYVIMKTFADKLLVCHYNKPYKKIVYTVVQMSSTKRIIKVSKCVELMTGDSSKIITLKRRCKFVNIVVNKVDTVIVNNSAIKPLSESYIKKYCFFKYFSFVGFFMTLRHLFFELILGQYFLRALLNSIFNYILIGTCILVPAIIVFLYRIGYARKAKKARNGRALEYEFV